MLRDPLASTAQPLSSGSPDCSSVTRLLLGPCYTDPEILDAEGTQLSGQTELLKLGSLGPRNQPALPLLGLLLGFFFFFLLLWEMITGPCFPANHCQQA